MEASSGTKPKLYVRNINFESRKYLGQNKATEYMKNTIEKSLGESLRGASKGVNVKQEVVTTSKPDLATKAFAKDDEGVQELFSKEPYNRLKERYHQIFGPKGEDGKILRPSSENSKAYFEQSVSENTH